MNKETFISVDVETCGPVPGLYHMLELGACVVDVNGNQGFGDTFMGSLELNHDTYHERVVDGCMTQTGNLTSDCSQVGWEAQTWNWWHHKTRVQILESIFAEARSAQEVLVAFSKWIAQFQNPIVVGFPVAHESMWLQYYWWKHIGTTPPFKHRGIDGKTLMMAAMKGKCGYSGASKLRLADMHPAFFSKVLPHTHRALDDAKEQAFLFANLMRELNLGHLL